MSKRGRLGGLGISLMLIAWGCTNDRADIGSNQVGGEAGELVESDFDGEAGARAMSGSGGSLPGSGASTQSGGAPSTGGSLVEPAGRSAIPGAAGEESTIGMGGAGSGATGSGGNAGSTDCDCPFPTVLGGDCCTARDACATDGVECELLRSSIVALRAWTPEEWGSPEADARRDCISSLSQALVARCAFVAPECGEPAEDYATFGEEWEEGHSECTESETRGALRCGEPGSNYAPDCCQRQRCLEDSECASGRCIFRRAQTKDADPSAYPHVVVCSLDEQGCRCDGVEAGERHTGYCIGDDEDIAAFDCEVASKSCGELSAWEEELLLSGLSSFGIELPQAAADAYGSCHAKISIELARRCGSEDCRRSGCIGPSECTACPDPEGESQWLCLVSAENCSLLEGFGGWGNAD
jgi:hypothetical protein